MPDPALKLVHNYVWRRREGQAWIICRCGKTSPIFEEVAEFRFLIEWANAHTKEVRDAA